MNFGIEGLHMCTIEHYYLQEKLLRVFQKYRQNIDDSSSDEEYVLIFALTGTITHGNNDWLIDSGATKHMIGFRESFVKLFEHESPHKVKLGDDY